VKAAQTQGGEIFPRGGVYHPRRRLNKAVCVLMKVLSMKKPIMAQLLMLLDSFPPIISDASIEFLVDPKAFAVALMAACGQLKKTGADSKVWWCTQLITTTTIIIIIIMHFYNATTLQLRAFARHSASCPAVPFHFSLF